MALLKTKNSGGFSYIEAIVSIFLLSCGIVAVLALIVSAFKSSAEARDQQVAAFLAQEGVELVRNIRDNNWAAKENSFNNLPSVTGETICRVDVSMNNLSNECSDDMEEDKKLYLDSDGFYAHGGSEETKFRRMIRFYPLDDGNIGAESIVIWGEDWQTPQNCNAITKCAFSRITMERWGE